MRVIKVPTNTIPVRHEDKVPVVTTEENYFWFALNELLRGVFRTMSAFDVHKNIEFKKEITDQKGAKELRIQREADYELLNGWVGNGKNWPGEAEDVDALFLAVRDAEKVKAAPRESKIK